jgi:type VI secretion system protein ImpF
MPRRMAPARAMNDLRRPLERLQPALLDRLTDDRPHEKVETRRERVISEQQLRDAVRRDLTWLFSTTRLDADMDARRFDQARCSVVNFGLPPLSGRTDTSMHNGLLEKSIREAILEFEPRILAATLRVRAIDAQDLSLHYKIGVEISGHLWAQPAPFELMMRTEIDLETNEVKVEDVSRARGA